MILSVIKLCVEEARKSDHQHKMGAVIFNKKIIISSGRNYSSRSAKHLHPRFMRWIGSVHAEAAAILQARRDLKNYSMCIIRVNNNGEFLMAKPCDWCLDYIKFCNLKSVYFSTSQGTIERILI